MGTQYAASRHTHSREMTKADIVEASKIYGRAAAMTMEAGADGAPIEIHAANGYLTTQQ